MTDPRVPAGPEVFDPKLQELLNIPQKILRRLAVSANGFVFDPTTGQSFLCNETGLDLLHRLQDASSPQELLQDLAREYAVAPRTLERDLLEFVGLLREHLGV